MTLLVPNTSYKRQIAGRCGLSNRTAVPSGASNAPEVQSWFNVPVTEATNNIEVEWANLVISPTYNGISDVQEIINGHATMTVRCGVLIGATTYPLYAPDGSRDLVIEPGEVKRFLPLAQAISPGFIQLKYRIVYPSVPPRWMTFENHQFSSNEFGTGLTDRTTASSWSSPPNTSGFVVFPPQAIIGDGSSKKIVEIWGDSIGSNSQSDSGYVADLGFIQKSLVAGSIPFISNGRQGMAMWQYSTEAAGWKDSRLRRRAITPSRAVTHCFLQMVTNDFSWTKNDTEILASLATLKAENDARGVKTIPFTCPPRTNSSNNGKFGSDSSSVWTWRTAYNQALRDANGCGYGLVDIASVLEDGSTNLWVSGYTADGIHPNATGHAAAKTYLDGILPKLLQNWGGI